MDNLAISATSLGSWLTCRQEAAYRLQGWTQIRYGVAKGFGLMMHHCLEVCYDTLRQAPDLRREKWTDGRISERIEAIVDYFLVETERKTLGEVTNEKEADEIMKAMSEIRVLAPRYFVFWKDMFGNEDRFKPVGSAIRIVETEKGFKIPFGTIEGCGVTLIGYIDGFGLINQAIWILETKTTSKVYESGQEMLAQVAFQNKFYTLALKMLLGGKKVSGVIYNMVRRPSIQIGSSSLKQYEERLAKNVDEKPGSYFLRFPTTFTNTEMALFCSGLIPTLREYILWRRGLRPTYRSDSGRACLGRYPCDYMEACAEPGRHISEIGSFEIKQNGGRKNERTEKTRTTKTKRIQ